MAQNQGMVPTFRTSSPPPWVLRPNGAPCPTWVATENTDDGTSVAWYPSKWDLYEVWWGKKKNRGISGTCLLLLVGNSRISRDFKGFRLWNDHDSYMNPMSWKFPYVACWPMPFVQMMLRDLMPVPLRFCQGLVLRIEHIVGPCGTPIWTDPVQNRGL